MTTLVTPLRAAPAVEAVQAPFTISVNTDAAESVITICGELDLAAAPHLEQALEGLCRPGHQNARTTLDCTALTYCGTAGLAVLVRAHRHHQASGGHLTLTPSPHVLERLLTLAGLKHYLDIAATTPHGAPPTSSA